MTPRPTWLAPPPTARSVPGLSRAKKAWLGGSATIGSPWNDGGVMGPPAPIQLALLLSWQRDGQPLWFHDAPPAWPCTEPFRRRLVYFHRRITNEMFEYTS